MNVRLLRRWGSKLPGESVTVDDTQGRWLVQHAYGTANGVQGPSQAAAAPGTDGPDPLAGGDATRQGTPQMQKAPHRDNAAWPVPGSPVQFNAGVAPDTSDGLRASRGRKPSEDATEPDTGPSTKVSGSGRRKSSD